MRRRNVRIKPRSVAAITAIGVLATAVLAGTAFAQDASDGGDEPITLIVGYTQPPNTMNPLKGILTQEYEAFSMMYPLLFNFDKDSLVATADEQSLAAELPTADNGGISADGLTYTIKIRDGVHLERRRADHRRRCRVHLQPDPGRPLLRLHELPPLRRLDHRS